LARNVAVGTLITAINAVHEGPLLMWKRPAFPSRCGERSSSGLGSALRLLMWKRPAFPSGCDEGTSSGL